MTKNLRPVAALFVDACGIYSMAKAVECHGIELDARNYAGAHPVVAHPPCHLWTNLAAVNYKRYGGDHNRPGNDGHCFVRALNSVRRCGGVLEHPAYSNAWKHYGIARPIGLGWRRVADTEWVCEVWQSAYGHKARKRTWLVYVSQNQHPPLEGRWARRAGTHQCGWFDRKKPTLSKKEASATPIAFAQWLIELARSS